MFFLAREFLIDLPSVSKINIENTSTFVLCVPNPIKPRIITNECLSAPQKDEVICGPIFSFKCKPKI